MDFPAVTVDFCEIKALFFDLDFDIKEMILYIFKVSNIKLII